MSDNHQCERYDSNIKRKPHLKRNRTCIVTSDNWSRVANNPNPRYQIGKWDQDETVETKGCECVSTLNTVRLTSSTENEEQSK